MREIKTITLEEYRAQMKAQGAKSSEDLVFVCPMCGTMQDANDLISAGAGKNMDEVEKYLGFSCIGRFTGAGSPRKKPDGKPCNWTLGGLFQTHTLAVILPDGTSCPRFELATPENAKKHWESTKRAAEESQKGE
jgi:hypothetical protein